MIHIIVSYDQNISSIFYVKDGSNFRLRHPSCVYITAQRQYTAVQKTKDVYTSEITFLALLHPCIITSLHSIFYCVQLLYTPISKHLYSGIFIDPLNKKHKIFKNRLNSKMFCYMFKIAVFCSCKT